jgi:hypothetical protein
MSLFHLGPCQHTPQYVSSMSRPTETPCRCHCGSPRRPFLALPFAPVPFAPCTVLKPVLQFFSLA